MRRGEKEKRESERAIGSNREQENGHLNLPALQKHVQAAVVSLRVKLDRSVDSRGTFQGKTGVTLLHDDIEIRKKLPEWVYIE